MLCYFKNVTYLAKNPIDQPFIDEYIYAFMYPPNSLDVSRYRNFSGVKELFFITLAKVSSPYPKQIVDQVFAYADQVDFNMQEYMTSFISVPRQVPIFPN